MPVAVCTYIYVYDTLVHLVGFTIEIILRYTALWTSN